MIADQESVRKQIERILRSETFSTSPVSRRLLEFLAEKSLAGEGDEVKEYTIAVDGLGKHPTYDPQHESAVRIQVGRLRQKLTEYYRSEGACESLVIEVPKGHFSLEYASRRRSDRTAPADGDSGAQNLESRFELKPQPAPSMNSFRGQNAARTAIVLGILLLASISWAAFVTFRLWFEQPVEASQINWTPEVERLWLPFTDPRRPTLVSIPSPLYIGFQGQGVYRDLALNNWNDVLHSTEVRDIQKALGSKELVPRYYYTGFGDAAAAFELARVLGAKQPELSLVSANKLTLEQLSDNNVVSIGPPKYVSEELQTLTNDVEFVMDDHGITNLHPRPGEPVRLLDRYPSIKDPGISSMHDDGKIYVLVTRTYGPLGKGAVEIFSSNHNPGAFAAMQWFTTPRTARLLENEIAPRSKVIPSSFQVVLQVQFKDSVPTHVSYVMSRAL